MDVVQLVKQLELLLHGSPALGAEQRAVERFCVCSVSCAAIILCLACKLSSSCPGRMLFGVLCAALASSTFQIEPGLVWLAGALPEISLWVCLYSGLLATGSCAELLRLVICLHLALTLPAPNLHPAEGGELAYLNASGQGTFP
jgi:hypothetical protein